MRLTVPVPSPAPPDPRADLVAGLLADVAAESADLEARVAPLPAAAWRRPTPAAGWTILDTVNHLAATDTDALEALTTPDAFLNRLPDLAERVDTYVDDLVAAARTRSPADVLADWRSGRGRLLEAVGRHDPAARIPWFGPPMSVASFLTARLMETWAHGQDVADALGQDRMPTARLRSVAEIGWRARPFAYAARGLPMPRSPVRVVLIGPDGQRWQWGPDAVDDVIEGSALDFCLLVTQRRHRDDLALSVRGPAAQEWAGIAQAFAGAPGAGREPRG